MSDDILGGVLGGIGGLIQAGTNIYQAHKNNQINQQNFQLQKEQFEYQKELQEKLFQREDNAVQRHIADLESAGLNRLHAVGGQGANAGQIVQTQAPQQAHNEKIDLSNALQFATDTAYNFMKMKMDFARSQADIDKTNSEVELNEYRKKEIDNLIEWRQKHGEGIDADIKYKSKQMEEINNRIKDIESLIKHREHLNALNDSNRYMNMVEQSQMEQVIRTLETQGLLNKQQAEGIRHRIIQGYIGNLTDLSEEIRGWVQGGSKKNTWINYIFKGGRK